MVSTYKTNMAKNYYDKNLSAERLKLVYDLATPRVRQYLEAEIAFVLERLRPTDVALELGCGYGRVLNRLSPKARLVVGVDTSVPSLIAATQHVKSASNVRLAQMNAAALGFTEGSFDCVICIQNGISAFHVNPQQLLSECSRVTKGAAERRSKCAGRNPLLPDNQASQGRPEGIPDGALSKILLSTYSAKFWEHRLEWFRIQSEHGLIGEIDWSMTGEGDIVCKDGFRATTFSPVDFAELVSPFGLTYQIHEVDDSSLFCEIVV